MDEWTLNDLLECSVCLERLDTSSKVLPCQHTFCKKCLVDIFEAHKELRCPECRVLIECGIDELPTNVLLMRILESMKNPTKVKTPSATPAVPSQGTPEAKHHHRHHQSTTPGAKTETPSKQTILHGQPCARALYSYASPESGDLNFKKGDLILLRKKVDANWYQGECNGNRGVFPSVYVDVITPLPSPVPQCKALYDFKMNTEEEEGCLAFKKGEVITVIRRVDENWAEGKLAHKIGIFPLAFVEMNHVARALMKLSTNSQPGPSKVAPPTPSEETTPLIPTTEHKPLSTVAHSVALNPSLNAQNRLEPSSSSQSPSSSTTPNSSTSTSTPSSTAPSSPASPPLQHGGDKPPPPNPRSTASASHAQHREKRHSLNLLHPNNPPVTQRYSGEVTAPEAGVSVEKHHGGSSGQGSSRGHRHKRSVSDQQNNVQLPANYVAMYPYKPQKADELELKKGVMYTVTEKCQDGWFRGTSQVTHKTGVFPGNYVALPKNQSSPGNRNQPGQAQGSLAWGRQPPSQPAQSKQGASSSSDRPYMDLAKSVLAAAQAAVQTVTSSSQSAPVGSKPSMAQSNLSTPPELPPRSASPNVSSLATGASISSPWHSQGDQAHMVTVTPSPRGQPSLLVTVSTSVTSSPNAALTSQASRAQAEKARDKKSLGSGLIRRLATIKNSKSPPPSTYSMDNPVFEDGGTDIVTATPAVADLTSSLTPVHTRSGSCPSQLLQQQQQQPQVAEVPHEGRHRAHPFSGGSQRVKHKEPRANIVTANPGAFTSRPPPLGATADSASPLNPSHRKSNSLDATSSDQGKKSRPVLPLAKERFRCIVAYPPNSEYELALQVGDVIYVHKKRDDGWYKGTQERTGRTGLFPASFVEAL